MKLKYYLRGAGIALILAVLLTHVSHGNEVSASADNSMLTEEETDISASEEEYNTVGVSGTEDTEDVAGLDENVLNETITETQSMMESVESGLDYEDSGEAESVDVEAGAGMIEEEKQAEQSVVEEQDVQPTTVLTIDANAQEIYLLNIVSGDDSGTVSRKLYNAGLVDNASEFDAFLMQHGYDKKIRVGTVEVPIGSTWLEIAEKLAGK